MDSSTHPRFDLDYWEWPGKIVAYPTGSSFDEVLEIVSTKPDANPWILFKINHNGEMDAITFVLDDKENDIYALYVVQGIVLYRNYALSFREGLERDIRTENYQQVGKIIDDIVGKSTSLSLQGVWTSLSEYSTPTYESMDDIKDSINNMKLCPLILLQAIPKFPHSINKRRIG